MPTPTKVADPVQAEVDIREKLREAQISVVQSTPVTIELTGTAAHRGPQTQTSEQDEPGASVLQ